MSFIETLKLEQRTVKNDGDFIKLSDEDMNHLDRVLKFKEAPERRKWENRHQFTMSCIAFATGLENFWTFPWRVYKTGQGLFILVYIVLAALIGFPLILLELIVGQFASQSCTQCFRSVPLFIGLGWCYLAIMCFSTCFRSVFLSWSYFHFLTTNFNLVDKYYCSVSNSCMPYKNNNTIEMSNSEFWETFVRGYNNSENISLKNIFHTSHWGIIFVHLYNWVIICCIIILVSIFTRKVVYVTSFIPYLILYVMILLGSTLPGAMKGVQYVLSFQLDVSFDQIVISAFEQLYFSLSLSCGSFIGLSSLNDFHHNIINNAIGIVLLDTITSFLCTLAFGGILGFTAHLYNSDISTTIQDSLGFMFIVYPIAFYKTKMHEFWINLFIFAIGCLNLNSILIMLEITTASFKDTFKKLRKRSKRFILFCITLCFVYFLVSLFLIQPFGQHVLIIFCNQYQIFIMILMSLLELLIFGAFYNYKTFRQNLGMILKKEIPIYFTIVMFILTPLLLLTFVVYKIILLKTQKNPYSEYPALLYFICTIISFLIILPIFIGMICALTRAKRIEKSFKDTLIRTITVPYDFGPELKINWCCSKYYLSKLATIYAEDFQKLVTKKQRIKF